MNATVQAARGCIGTPYLHQGRKVQQGLDCVGLLIVVGRQVGAVPPDFDITGYRRLPDGFSLMRHLRDTLTEIDSSVLAPGDFICIAYDRIPHHVAIIGDYPGGGLSMIHAHNTSGVVESRLVFGPSLRLVAAFRLEKH